MAKITGEDYRRMLAEKQLKSGLRTLLSSVLHTQNRLEGALTLSESTMNEGELADSKVYASLCQLEEQLSASFNVITNELKKED